jgi:RimJ/RimL family protein N-acetyltransferase
MPTWRPDPDAGQVSERAVVRLRRVGQADSDLLLEWANDPETRAASFHPAPIFPVEHRRWLASRLASATTAFWIGEVDGTPVGQIRIEIEPDGTGEIGVSVASDARGSGIGRSLLAAALSEARRTLPVTTFLARVRLDNSRSLALFRSAGFVERGQRTCAGVPCLELEARPGS